MTKLVLTPVFLSCHTVAMKPNVYVNRHCLDITRHCLDTSTHCLHTLGHCLDTLLIALENGPERKKLNMYFI